MNKFIKISFIFSLLFLVSSFCYPNTSNFKEEKITEASPDARIGNCYEPLTYKLILSTPKNDEKILFDWFISEKLIFPLLDKTQFKTFDDITKKLLSWQLEYYPLEDKTAIVLTLENKLKRIEFKENYVKGSITNEGFVLTREAYGQCKECVPVLEQSIVITNPLEYVLVHFTTEIMGFKAGSTVKMPALAALYLFNKDRRELIVSGSKTIFDIALLAVGVGELQAAYKAYQGTRTIYATYVAVKALGDVGMSITDIVINDALAQQWAQTPEGQKRLERWNTINTYYAIGTITASSVDMVIQKINSRTIKNAEEFNKFANELEIRAGLNVAGSLAQYAGKATKGIKNILPLESPTGLFRQLKSTNGQTYRAATFWTDEGADIMHYVSQDAKYYIKHDPTNGRVLFIDAQNNKFMGFMLDQDNIIGSNYSTLVENLKTIHGMPNSIRTINIKGTNITFADDKANLVLGKYKPNSSPGISGEIGTDDVIDQMTILKNYSFADKSFELRNGSVHVLNIPDGNITGVNDFFDAFNKGILDLAVNNPGKVKVSLISDPRKPALLNYYNSVENKFSGFPTTFAKEVKYLRDNGLKTVYLKKGTPINLDNINLDNLNWTGWKY